jgi:pilus assembly protein FimV
LGLSTNPNADDDFGAAPVVSAAKAPAMSDDIPMHDLTNEVQIPGHSASVVAAAAAPAAAPSAPVLQAAAKLAGEEAGMDFASLDFDFDIPKSHTEEPGHAQGHDHREELASLDTTHIDTLKPAGLDYDLSSIDLNLPKAEAHSVSPLEAAAGAAHSGNSMEFSAPKVAEVQQEAHNELAEVEFSAEMATKLDLAVAYQEIGDKDGARELLEEVLKGGNQEQIARAKTMMHELA